MTTRAADFIETLRKSRLLDQNRVDEILRTPETAEVDAPTLGQCLVQLGWLTAFQVDELLQGHAATLILGPYRIEDRLGSGDRAFTARHPEKDGRLVVKLLPADSTLAQQLSQQVHAAAQLAHPNVARISELEALGTERIYVREYVEGTDLAQLVQDHGPLPVTYACDYIHQAAQGLKHAHERGLAHGHLQASNLIVAQGPGLVGAASNSDSSADGLPTPGAVLKVVDFGLAPLHDAGSAAPSDPVRLGRDIGDLGRTLAFALSGPAGPNGLMARSDVPDAVRSILRKMLAEEPTDRYASVSAVVQDLEGLSNPDAAPTPAAEPVLSVEPLTPPEPLRAAPAPDLDMPIAVPPPPAPFGAGAPMEAVSTEPVSFSPAPAMGYVAVEDAPPLAAPIGTDDATAVEAPPVEPERMPVRQKKRKYGPSFYFWAGVGLLLHLVFIVGLIWLIMTWTSAPRPTIKHFTAPAKTAPGKRPNKPKAEKMPGNS